MPVAHSHITITAYDVSLGTRLSSHDISASWIAQESRYYLLSFLDSFSKSKIFKQSVLPTNFLIIALLLYDLLKAIVVEDLPPDRITCSSFYYKCVLNCGTSLCVQIYEIYRWITFVMLKLIVLLMINW